MKVSDLLEKFNLGLDDLNSAERQTLNDWLGKLQTKQLTLPDVQTYIAAMISGIERELAGLEAPPSIVSWLFNNRRTLYLRARLKNCLMLQDFMLGPERAKKWIETQLANVK